MSSTSKPATAVLQIAVEGETHQESGRFVARCPKLQLSASGETPESAMERWQSVFAAYITSCESRGVLLNVLRGAGIKYKILYQGEQQTRHTGEDWNDLPPGYMFIPFLTWQGGSSAGSASSAG